MKILLISTYELSRQPFGLASPAAWLRREGHRVTCIDCAFDPFATDGVRHTQLAIRLLVPEGSKLLERSETSTVMGPFNEELLSYEWQNPDPLVDELHRRVMRIIRAGSARKATRRQIFRNVWDSVNTILRKSDRMPEPPNHRSWASIPYLNEPWYC